MFIKSLVDVSDIPQNLPNILILGRSNVGKSSFINALFNNKNMARISKKPGKTNTINLFVTRNIYLLDAPGYGYAKVAKKKKLFFEKLIINFIENNPFNKYVFLIIDFFVGPTEKDLHFYHFLLKQQKKIIIIANKWDKMKKSLQKKQEVNISKFFQKEQQIYFISAKKKINIHLIKKAFL